MRALFTLVIILTFLFSCKPARYTPKNYKESQLIFGTSGGVSGMLREYRLLDNGQLFLSKGVDGEWKELRKIKKSTTRDIFEKATELGIETMTFNHPGNMTYFLIIKHPPRSNEIKWGEAGVSTPDGIKEFYDYLLTICKP